MSAHNPNNHDAYEIQGVGLLDGKSWGETSAWNAPGTIETDYGTATRNGMSYLVTAPLLVVTITSQGGCYHAPECVDGAPVPVQTAQALGRKPCSHCRPDETRVAIVAAEIRRPRKRNLAALYAAIS